VAVGSGITNLGSCISLWGLSPVPIEEEEEEEMCTRRREREEDICSSYMYRYADSVTCLRSLPVYLLRNSEK
jgi:hypothetical protein